MLNIMNPPADWSTMKKLIWLRGEPIWSGGGEEMTVSGATPLTITNALHKPMLKCETNILPKQDLHGYDAPWPAGGGKNLLDSSFCLDRTSRGITTRVNSDGSITVTGTSDGTARYWNSQDTLGLVLEVGTYTLSPSGLRLEKSGGGTASGTFTLSEQQTFINIYFVGWTNGETVNTTIYPQLEKSSSATTYSPYSNICPIVGWDGAEVYVGSANIWDEEWEEGSINNSTGANSPDTNNIRAKNYIPITPNTSYYFVCPSASENGIRIYWYESDHTFIVSNSTRNNAVTAPSNARYLRIRTTGTYGNVYQHNVAVNYPDTVTTYNPHTASTASVTFDSTVYGGSYEFVGGQGSVSHAMVDLGDLDWSYQSEYARFRAPLENLLKSTSAATVMDIYCSQYKKTYMNATRNNDPNYVTGIIATGTADYVYLVNTAYTDASALKTAVAGVQFAYPLATPTPFTADGADIKTFKGQNYVWTDCGNAMEVKYIGKTE